MFLQLKWSVYSCKDVLCVRLLILVHYKSLFSYYFAIVLTEIRSFSAINFCFIPFARYVPILYFCSWVRCLYFIVYFCFIRQRKTFSSKRKKTSLVLSNKLSYRNLSICNYYLNIQYAEAIPWFKLQGTADQIRSSEKFSEISGHIEIIEVLKFEKGKRKIQKLK